MSGRGKGHIRDRRPTAPGFAALARAYTPDQPIHVDMVAMIDHLRDQSITSSCVGFAFARGVHLRAAILYPSTPIAYPSATGIYTVARLKAGGPLVDAGCEPSMAVIGMMERGMVGEDRLAFDPGHINDMLPWDVFQAGCDATLDGAFRIGEAPLPSRIDEIDGALARGFPVPFGMHVDDAYEQILGETAYAGPTGEDRGSHMQVIIDDPRAPDDEYTVAGSWSDWGFGPGLVRIKKAFIASPFCTDFYALHGAPEGVH